MITVDLGGLADWVSGLGSLAAVAVALHGFKIVRDQRAADRTDAERGIAHELIATVADVGNHIKAIERHFAEQRNDITVERAGEPTRVFRVVNALIGLSNEGEISVPVGSTELLVKAGALDLWSDVRLLAARNRSLTALMKEYRILWGELQRSMPLPFQTGGARMRMRSDDQGFLGVHPVLIQTDSVVGALLEQVQESSKLVDVVAAQIGPVMRAYFKEPFLGLNEDANGGPAGVYVPPER